MSMYSHMTKHISIKMYCKEITNCIFKLTIKIYNTGIVWTDNTESVTSSVKSICKSLQKKQNIACEIRKENA